MEKSILILSLCFPVESLLLFALSVRPYIVCLYLLVVYNSYHRKTLLTPTHCYWSAVRKLLISCLYMRISYWHSSSPRPICNTLVLTWFCLRWWAGDYFVSVCRVQAIFLRDRDKRGEQWSFSGPVQAFITHPNMYLFDQQGWGLEFKYLSSPLHFCQTFKAF